MKLILLFVPLFSNAANSQIGFLVERIPDRDTYRVGLLVLTKNQKHVFGFSSTIPTGPITAIQKFGYGYCLDKNSYPYIEIGSGRFTDTEPNRIHFTIGYTFKYLHVGYDFRKGVKFGLYVLFSRKKKE